MFLWTIVLSALAAQPSVGLRIPLVGPSGDHVATILLRERESALSMGTDAVVWLEALVQTDGTFIAHLGKGVIMSYNEEKCLKGDEWAALSYEGRELSFSCTALSVDQKRLLGSDPSAHAVLWQDAETGEVGRYSFIFSAEHVLIAIWIPAEDGADGRAEFWRPVDRSISVKSIVAALKGEACEESTC